MEIAKLGLVAEHSGVAYETMVGGSGFSELSLELAPGDRVEMSVAVGMQALCEGPQLAARIGTVFQLGRGDPGARVLHPAQERPEGHAHTYLERRNLACFKPSVVTAPLCDLKQGS